MLDHPRGQTAQQRQEQQRVDRGEPETAEHVERLQSIQPRPDHRVGGQVVADLAGVEAALRQQRAGNRTQRQQEQQHQPRAHRGQRPPGVAGLRDKRSEKPAQIGNLTSDTNASRSQDTKSFHTPLTRATPTAISSTPPKICSARVCRRSQSRPPTAAADPKANSTNGIPRPRQYAITNTIPRATLAPSVADATVMTPASVGPRHGVQPSAKTAPSRGAPASVDNCRGANRSCRCSVGT